jgi:hypothetical protein
MHPHSRRRLGALLAFAVVVLALLAAGCGGSSSETDDSAVASIDDESSATPAADTSGGTTGAEPEDFQQAALEFTQCMRDHGIDMPDPDFSEGRVGVQIGGPESDIDPSDPDFQAAQEECGEILESARPQLSEEDQQAFQDAFLEYAQCMRDHGIDMPDPDFSEGGGGVRIGGPDSDFDPNDPDFRAADEECRPILENAGFGGGPGGRRGGGDENAGS